MKRNRKKPPHKRAPLETQLTEAQKDLLIPGGPVSAQRAQRDEIRTETRSTTKKGAAIVTGQYVSTPARKLMEAGYITLLEWDAACAFENDHDIGVASSKNILSALVVDGGQRDGSTIDMKLDCINRFRKANARLGSEGSAVAMAAVIRHGSGVINTNYLAIGADLLPGASKPEQVAAGKGVAVHTLRRLAEIYGKRNPRKSHIIFEEST